jgi:hypothetical protein
MRRCSRSFHSRRDAKETNCTPIARFGGRHLDCCGAGVFSRRAFANVRSPLGEGQGRAGVQAPRTADFVSRESSCNAKQSPAKRRDQFRATGAFSQQSPSFFQNFGRRGALVGTSLIFTSAIYGVGGGLERGPKPPWASTPRPRAIGGCSARESWTGMRLREADVRRWKDR